MGYYNPTDLEKTAYLVSTRQIWQTDNITFTFAQNLVEMTDVAAPDGSTFLAMNSNDPLLSVFRLSAVLWDDLITNSITESFDHSPDAGDIHIARYDAVLDYATGAYPENGDIWVANGPKSQLPPSGGSIPSSAIEAMMHEFGHALGLYHAGGYNTGSSLIPSSFQDSKVYSIMSYFGPGRPEVNDVNVTVNFSGGGGSNTLDFSLNTNGIQLYYSTPGILKASNGSKFFTSFQKFEGGVGNDRLTLLDGMTEVDGGGGINVLDISYWYGGTVTHYWESGEMLFSTGSVIVNNFQNLVYRPGQVNIMGTDNGEAFVGSTGPDKIWGMGGDDIFQYSTGNDQLWGGAGIDRFTVSAGDAVDGGDDYDILYLNPVTFAAADLDRFVNIEEFNFTSTSSSGIGYTFKQNSTMLTIFGTGGVDSIKFDSPSGHKHVETRGGSDFVWANGSGYYDGGEGNGDKLYLNNMPGITWDKAAQDFLWQGQVIHYENFESFSLNYSEGITIYGTGGSDGLMGSIYDWTKDVLDGREGNDFLTSTGGGDILTGGTGSDTFRFRSSADAAIITDFERGVDSLIGDFNPGWTPPWWEQHGNDQWLVHDGDVVAKLLNVGTDPISITWM